MVKELKRQKRRELSLPGVASMGGADYDFFEESIANRLARWTNGLGAHPGLHHGDGGPEVRAERSTPSVARGESGEIEASNGEIVWRQDSTVRKRHAHQHDSSSSTRDYISSY
jgi:hypothetical protein